MAGEPLKLSGAGVFGMPGLTTVSQPGLTPVRQPDPNVTVNDSPTAQAFFDANDPGSGGGGGGVNPNNQIRGSINSRFDTLLQQLTQAEGRLNESEGRFKNQADLDFNTGRTILDSSKGQGLATIDRSREKVQENKSRTLQELDANIRNAFDAGAIRLGNLGAADSSASGQLGFALTKLQNQNRGNVLRDVNQQNLDLDLAVKEVETEFGNQLLNLTREKDKAKFQIAEDFERQRRLIEAEKQNATAERQQALDNLSLQLAQSAAADISGIESTATAQANDIMGRAKSAAANIASAFSGRTNSIATGVSNQADQTIQGLQSNVNPQTSISTQRTANVQQAPQFSLFNPSTREDALQVGF